MNSNKSRSICHFIIAGALLSSHASADSETDLMLINACMNCHDTQRNCSSGQIPSIADLSTQKLLQMLTNFKNQTTTNTIMNRIMAKYEIKHIEQLSLYYGNLQKFKPTPASATDNVACIPDSYRDRLIP